MTGPEPTPPADVVNTLNGHHGGRLGGQRPEGGSVSQ
jgi:hypothetical protein